MPISVTGNSTEAAPGPAWMSAALAANPARHRRGAGFTLLELLVSLAIVGLLAGAAVLALPDRSAGQRLQARATAILGELRLAANEARALGQPVRVEVLPQALRFEVYSGSRWRGLSLGGAHEDGKLRLARTRLHLSSRELPSAGHDWLLLLPDGSRKAFRLELRLQQAGLRIEGDETGALRLVAARVPG